MCFRHNGFVSRERKSLRAGEHDTSANQPRGESPQISCSVRSGAGYGDRVRPPIALTNWASIGRKSVGVSVANPSFLVVAVFALLRRGYRCRHCSGAPCCRSCKRAGIRTLIYDSHGLMLSGGRNITVRSVVDFEHRREAVRSSIPIKPPFENGDVIFFTSGTTGLPKKVIAIIGSARPVAKIPAHLRLRSGREDFDHAGTVDHTSGSTVSAKSSTPARLAYFRSRQRISACR